MARQPRSASLGVLARMAVSQLDPVHETGARLFKRDRSCWKSGLRSARFTNAHCGRPSAPPREMAADPVKHSGQTVPVRMSAFLRHISIMHLLSLGHEKREAGFWCLAWSHEARLTWVNVMRLVSDEASRLSVQTWFRTSRAQIHAHAGHRARITNRCSSRRYGRLDLDRCYGWDAADLRSPHDCPTRQGVP